MTSLAARGEHLWQKRDTPRGARSCSATPWSRSSRPAVSLRRPRHRLRRASTSGPRCRAPSSPTPWPPFPSYWLNRNWVWGKRGRSHSVKEIVPFWIMSALGIASRSSAPRWPVTSAHVHHLEPLRADGRWCSVANVAVVRRLRGSLKFLIFNRLFHGATELEEFDVSCGGGGGRRAALEGAAVALLVLGALVAASSGPTLIHLVPLTTLRLVVGGPAAGVRPAVAAQGGAAGPSGLKAKHDEDAIFAEQVAALSGSPPAAGRDTAGSWWRSRGCSSRASKWR